MSVEAHEHPLPERPDVDVRWLMVLGCGVLVLLAAAVLGLGALYSKAVPVKTVPPLGTFPAPRIQPDEAAELRQILSQQQQKLTGYRWANQAHTLLQIPIETAMQIIAQKGAHAYDPIVTAPAALASPERAITPSSAPSQPSSGSNGAAEKSP
jgi:hypothetical protein